MAGLDSFLRIGTRLGLLALAAAAACSGDDDSETPAEPRETVRNGEDPTEACFPTAYDMVGTFIARGLGYGLPFPDNARLTPYEPIDELSISYQFGRVELASQFTDNQNALSYQVARWAALPRDWLEHHEELCYDVGTVGDREREQCQRSQAYVTARMMMADLSQQCFTDFEETEEGEVIRGGGCWGPILGALRVEGAEGPLVPDAERALMGSGIYCQLDWHFSDDPINRSNPETPLTARLELNCWSTNATQQELGDAGNISNGFWFEPCRGGVPTGPTQTITREGEEPERVTHPYFSNCSPIAKLEALTCEIPVLPCLEEGETATIETTCCKGASCNLIPGISVGALGLRLLVTGRNRMQ